MQCTQLTRLIKGWYLHVKDETMAPARMMQFVDAHIQECDVCRDDAELSMEIEKISEFILPESKIPKAYRAKKRAEAKEISPAEDEQPQTPQSNSVPSST